MITRLSVLHNKSNLNAKLEPQNNQTREFDSLSPTNQLSDSPLSSISTTQLSPPLISSSMARQNDPSNSNSSASSSSADSPSSPKSPILIKYNYYDYNGARQEQPNQDMRHRHDEQMGSSSSSGKPIQRQLSPSFKQNLDEIVRNSSQLQQRNKNGSMSSSSMSSPSPISPGSSCSNSNSPDQHQHHDQQVIHFARRYQLSSYEQRCLRCNKTVYQMDKVGPLKEFTFYHQNCFKCRECGTKLTLRTYFNNQQVSNDLEVYCHRHCPKTGPGKLDNQSVGIRAALNAPKVFDSCLFRDETANPTGSVANCNSAPNYNCSSLNSRLLLGHQSVHQNQWDSGGGGGGSNQPKVDSRALHIQHAVQQTKLQNIYRQSQVDKKISQFLERRLEYLEPKQKLLEMQHRKEEDALFREFELKWRQEEKSISEQIRDEWQVELNKLLDKYKRQLSSIGSNQSSSRLAAESKLTNNFNKAAADLPRQLLLLQQQAVIRPSSSPDRGEPNNNNNNGGGGGNSKQQMIEFERLNLEKTMTIKLDRKKETLKRKLKEFERQATAELVEKQSREMLALISMKLDEYKEEQKRKIGSDLEHFEAIEKLANRLAGSNLQADGGNNETGQQVCRRREPSGQQEQPLVANNKGAPSRGGDKFETPPPEAPQVSKMELYNYEEADEVFRDIDRMAISVAKEDQQSFTDLVHHLTRNCLTDVEKVRAIFRWITVKNLNTMQFDSSVKADTPLGLLRGIKNGSESYHVLFKRLCSYAGLHCVVIKGYSKSAGYQPGIKFEGNRFRNSWNAVYVAGAWRFVQCNWGARHLVSVAIMQDKNQPSNNNNNGLANIINNNLDPARLAAKQPLINAGQSRQPHRGVVGGVKGSGSGGSMLQSPNHGRRGLASTSSSSSSSSSLLSSCSSAASAMPHSHSHSHHHHHHHPSSHLSSQHHHHQVAAGGAPARCAPASPHAVPARSTNGPSTGWQANDLRHLLPATALAPTTKMSAKANNNNLSPSPSSNNDSLRYEYDDHYFLTDPDEFIYEFFPVAPEWQLLKARPIKLAQFEQLPFVRSLFFKYGLYFPQHDIRSVLYADSSGATTIKIGMPTHMIPSLIFHYNLKYYDSDLEHHDGVSLKRFVMQSVESGSSSDSASSGGQAQQMLSNVVSFRVHLPENGAYILDIFANSTTPNQYITGEPMKFKSVCKFKIVAKNLKTVMIPLPDCASGEFGPMKATRLFGLIPITHECALISVHNDKRFLEIQFRMTRPLIDFMASLHKNNYDEKQLSKAIKIFVDGDIVFVTVKFFEDGQYGLDIYTRDQSVSSAGPITTSGAKGHPLVKSSTTANLSGEPKKQLLTHCCKYLINVRTANR